MNIFFIEVFGITFGTNILHLIILLLIWIIITLRGYSFTFISVILAFLTAQYLGILSLSTKAYNLAAINTFSIGLIGFAVGVCILPWRIRKERRNLHLEFGYWIFPLYILLLFFTFMSTYHFFIGGITLFSDGLITERFDTTRSGLGGIPTRVILYCIPFYVFLMASIRLSLSNENRQLLHIQILYKSAWILFILTTILSGFKSSFITILTILLLIEFMDLAQTKFSSSFIKILKQNIRIVFLSVIGLTIALFRAFQIAQFFIVSDAGGIWISLVLRMTEVAEKPFFFIVNDFVPSNGIGFSYVLNDLDYFTSLIFGVKDESRLNSAELHVQSRISRTFSWS